ncbi:hypothetical protein BH10PAT3_BH10PAT3_3110 [soil metagenome]
MRTNLGEIMRTEAIGIHEELLNGIRSGGQDYVHLNVLAEKRDSLIYPSKHELFNLIIAWSFDFVNHQPEVQLSSRQIIEEMAIMATQDYRES